jgi:hypothetical protein
LLNNLLASRSNQTSNQLDPRNRLINNSPDVMNRNESVTVNKLNLKGVTTMETTDTGTIRNVTNSTDITQNFILPIPETVDNRVLVNNQKQNIKPSPDKSCIGENDSRLSRQSSTENNLLDNTKHDLYENEDVSKSFIFFYRIFLWGIINHLSIGTLNI